MTANRKRIIDLLKNNIVAKIAHNKTDEQQVTALKKELERNATMFAKATYEEKLAFVNEILEKLDWSQELAELVVEKEEATESNEKIKISAEKMKLYTELYETEAERLEKEISEIIYNDSLTGRYDILYGRLKEIKSAKGGYWGKEEINFVIDKREQGYTFKAIATILKRPERVVRLKYHEHK